MFGSLREREALGRESVCPANRSAPRVFRGVRTGCRAIGELVSILPGERGRCALRGTTGSSSQRWCDLRRSHNRLARIPDRETEGHIAEPVVQAIFAAVEGLAIVRLVERNDMPICCLIHLLEAIDIFGNGTPQLVVGRSCRAQKQSCDNSAIAWRKDRHVFRKGFFAGAVGSPGVPTDTL